MNVDYKTIGDKKYAIKSCDNEEYHDVMAAYAKEGAVPRFTPFLDGYAVDFLNVNHARCVGTVKVHGRIIKNWELD